MGFLTNLTGVGNIEVNAFQRLPDVVIQQSIREGFGLVVSEALRKHRPVVAGRAGGIPLQMQGGVGGVLVQSTEECGGALVTLLRDRQAATELAAAGHNRVGARFVLPRLLLDELMLMRKLPLEHDVSSRRTATPCAACGSPPTAWRRMRSSKVRKYSFCCDACREEFLSNPGHSLMRERAGGRWAPTAEEPPPPLRH